MLPLGPPHLSEEYSTVTLDCNIAMTPRIGADLAFLSEQIYEPWPRMHDPLLRQGLNLTRTWDHRDTQGAYVRKGTEWAAIVFRGTEASGAVIRDILSNIGWPVDWNGKGRIHSGYLKAIRRIAGDIFAFAEETPNDVPLYVTGHSMGGALATAGASFYGSEKPSWRLMGLVTFGAPKVLSRDGCKAIRTKIYRYVMPMDFAPSHPPSFVLRQPGEEIRLKPDSWWPGPVSRHDVKGYREAMERRAQEKPRPTEAERGVISA